MNQFNNWDAVQKRSFIVVKFIRNGETAGLSLLEGDVLEKTDDIFVAGKIMMVKMSSSKYGWENEDH